MYAGNAATIYKIERKIVMETMYVIEHNAVRVESSWLKQIRGKCIWVYYLKYTTRWHKNGTKRNYKFGWIKKSLEKAHLSVSCTAIGNWCFANVLNTFFWGNRKHLSHLLRKNAKMTMKIKRYINACSRNEWKKLAEWKLPLVDTRIINNLDFVC